jgi:CBS domain-containing protein
MTTNRTTTIDPNAVLARDVMRTELLVLRADDSIPTATAQLEEIRASGAPVVDASGRLLGVLSLRDIARSEHVDDGGLTTRLRREGESERTAEGEGEDEELLPAEAFAEQVAGRARIGDWMSPGVTTVAPDTALGALCRRMLDEGIHRVFVQDGKRLCGVVTTQDVVALIAGRAPRRRTARPHAAKR